MRFETVLVTGGGGYVGSVLVPRLLARGHRVRVLDLFLYGEHGLTAVREHPRLETFPGDLRDPALLARALAGADAVIHLACISNDPSFALDPALSRSINFDAFGPLVAAAKAAGVRRFVYASTSSVYGVSDLPEVTEDAPLVPLTDYNKYKGLCEPILLAAGDASFVPVVIRPATVCGFSPRMRLDLTVNILTNHAVNLRKITVLGGGQQRPNLHIEDMTDLYCLLLDLPDDAVAGKVWNAGAENATVEEIARRVKATVEAETPGRGEVAIETAPTDDKRSYHISSARITRDIGFRPRRTIEDAVRDLCRAFREGRIPGSLDDDRYYNIRRMQELHRRGALPAL